MRWMKSTDKFYFNLQVIENVIFIVKPWLDVLNLSGIIEFKVITLNFNFYLRKLYIILFRCIIFYAVKCLKILIIHDI